jgi:RNA polymerase sigma-70 factor, ECF subfamily
MESDEDLHVRIRKGDLHAFDDLYERYEVPLFGFLLGTLRVRADAEDALHEVFLRALKSPPPALSEGGFRPWLFRVARNHALNRIRGAGRAAAFEARYEAPESPPSAEERLERRELDGALADAVEKLPPRLAEVYRLRTSGLSYEEMAVVLEAPLGTVKSRMHELVKQLREDVKPWIAQE